MWALLYKKSTIEWCEDKYIHSNYIMEWYNTLSGIFLSLSGILFYLNNRHNVLISYFNDTIKIMVMLGIGTMLFHSTLLYFFQLTDEIPMLFLCFEYIKMINVFIKYYNLNEEQNITEITTHLKKLTYRFAICISLIGLVFDWLQVFLFQLFIFICVVYILTIYYYIEKHNEYLLKKLTRKKNNLEQYILYHYTVNSQMTILKNNIKFITQLQDNLKKYKKYFNICACCSVIVWLTDNLFCSQIKYYNLYFNGHALWHIFTSIGLYYSNMLMITQFKIIFWYKDKFN